MDIGHPKDVASSQSSSGISSLYSDNPHRSPSLERMSFLSNNQVPPAAFPLSYSQVSVPYGDGINIYNCQSLTRHAWVPEDNDLIIREIENALRYGPEYYGPPYIVNDQLALYSNQHYTLTSPFGFSSYLLNMEPHVVYHYMPQMVPPPHHYNRLPVYHYPRHEPYPNFTYNIPSRYIQPSRHLSPPRPPSPRESRPRSSIAELNRDQKKTLPGQHMATRIFKKNQEQAYRKRKSKKRVRGESKLKNEVKFSDSDSDGQ